jgi:GNAT superfamily N-acetyltransferase
MSATTVDNGQYYLDQVGLTPRRVIDDEDVEWLRIIRNTCRRGFAHDQEPISATAQEQWWAANQGDVIAYLHQDCDGFVVGYGLLRRDTYGRWWSSVAVLPPYSGRGYGGAITRHIIRQSPSGVVHAEALVDNPAADRLHNRDDWYEFDNDGVRRHYRTRAVLP